MPRTHPGGRRTPIYRVAARTARTSTQPNRFARSWLGTGVARWGSAVWFVVAIALPQAPLARAAFAPVSGTLTAQTSGGGFQSAPAAVGTPVSLIIPVMLPAIESASATFSALTSGDSLFDVSANATSTIGNPPAVSAASTVNFIQDFSTTGQRWLQLTARVESPPGDATATASLTLARVGQGATYSIGHTAGLETTREGLFASGNFRVTGAISTSASGAPGAHSAVIDGFVLIARLADYDNSGAVASADLATWRAGFGSTAAAFATGDLDGNARTDGNDFLLWQRQLGTAALPATAAGHAVPEPTALALLLLAAAAASYMTPPSRRTWRRTRIFVPSTRPTRTPRSSWPTAAS